MEAALAGDPNSNPGPGDNFSLKVNYIRVPKIFRQLFLISYKNYNRIMMIFFL